MARDGRRLNPGDAVAPIVGEPLRVLRPSYGNVRATYMTYIDVLQRSLDGSHFLGKTTGPERHSEWFSPEDVRNGNDEFVMACAHANVLPEQRRFREQEVAKLQEAFLTDNLVHLNEVARVPGFRTAASKYMVKVTRIRAERPARLRPDSQLQTANLSEFRRAFQLQIYDGEVSEIDPDGEFFYVTFEIPARPDSPERTERTGLCHARDAGRLQRPLQEGTLDVGQAVRVRILSELEGVTYLTLQLTDLLGVDMEHLIERFFRTGRPCVEELSITHIDWDDPPAGVSRGGSVSHVAHQVAQEMRPPDSWQPSGTLYPGVGSGFPW